MITEFWTSGAYSGHYGMWLWNNESGHFIVPDQVPSEGSTNQCLLINLESPDRLQSESCGQMKTFVCELSKETLVKGKFTYYEKNTEKKVNKE